MKKFDYFCVAEKCVWRHDGDRGTRAFCVLPTCPRGLRCYEINRKFKSVPAKPKPKPKPRPYSTEEIKEMVERRMNKQTIEEIAKIMERPVASVKLLLNKYDVGRSYKWLIREVEGHEGQDSESD